MAISIKRYLPRSLLGRALTILAAPIILVQVIGIWVYFDNHVDAVTRNAARSLAGEIALALNMAEVNTDPKQRASDLELAERFLSIHLTWRPGARIGTVHHVGEDTRAGTELIAAMQTLNMPFQVDTETLPRQIRVLVEGSTGMLEVVATRRKLGSTTNDIFVLWSIGSAVVTLGIAIIFMRNLVKPIRKLAEAADALRRDAAHVIVRIDGEGQRKIHRCRRGFLPC